VQILRTIVELRAALAGCEGTVFVPTMGNLHDGHLSLVRLARSRGKPVVVSIFVNRLQFAPHEDFAKYPRSFERDCALLAACGCDIIFAPHDREVYPEEQVYTVQPPAALGGSLEGAVRPAFFAGVATVVSKLFNIVQPAAAVFGKKDYQQLLVVEQLVRQMALPIEIIRGETVRGPSGLALSSRNGYFDPPQLEQAAELHAALRGLAAAAQSGNTDWTALERGALDELRAKGWQPDYVAVRRRTDLGAAQGSAPGELIVLAAARLGSTRLIDNLEI
jgi:pantoate--beta-alanine ligase